MELAKRFCIPDWKPDQLLHQFKEVINNMCILIDSDICFSKLARIYAQLVRGIDSKESSDMYSVLCRR